MDAQENDAPFDPAESLAIIDAQRNLTRDRSEPDPRVLFGVWGVAWLAGYLCLYVTAKDSAGHNPSGWAFAVFAALLALAIVATIVHVIMRTRGVQGVSARSGAMYGWSWSVGFVGIYLIIAGVERAGASQEVLSLLWNALPILLVGLLYLAGGALWQTNVMFALGVWFILLAGLATIIGLPTVYLVMAAGGGGGMLLGAVVVQLSRMRLAKRGR